MTTSIVIEPVAELTEDEVEAVCCVLAYLWDDEAASFRGNRRAKLVLPRGS